MTGPAAAEASEPLILIIDDDEAMRVSMRFLFSTVGLQAQCFERAEAFLAVYPDGDSGRPGCIVLDVRMAGMSGLELQRVLADCGCALPIVIVTGHGDVPMAVAALKAGAHDFIEKPFKEQALLDLVAGAVRLSHERLAAAGQRRALEARMARLSKREREVMQKVLEGKANKIIAFELDLSIKTIEVYRAAVMSKMEVRSVAELAQRAAQIGDIGAPREEAG
jgi:two-component system response regulator FixJ